MSPPPSPPTEARHAGIDGVLRPALSRLALLVGPSGYLVSIVYFFGFERTRRVYFSLGLDPSQLKLGPSDYVLRSVGPVLSLVPEVTLTLTAAAITTIAGSAMLRRWQRPPARPRPAMVAAVGCGVGAAAACVPFAVVSMQGSRPAGWSAAGLVAALVLARSAALAWQQAHADRVDASDHPEPEPSETGAAATGRGLLLGLVVAPLLLALVASSFQWAQDQARAAGSQAAENLNRNPRQFACASLVLRTPLTRPPVIGTWHPQPQVLDGVRLLLVAGGRLYVFDADGQPIDGTAAYPEQDVLLIETWRDRSPSTPGSCGPRG